MDAARLLLVRAAGCQALQQSRPAFDFAEGSLVMAPNSTVSPIPPPLPRFLDQTVGGAVATATHGSSMKWGSLSSQVRPDVGG